MRLKLTAMPNSSRSFLLIAATLLIWRLILSASLGLGDDEAYYWDWANHLDWGYFDHPAAVGWMIYATQLILPATEWAVRLPFLLLCGLSAWLFYRICRLWKNPDPTTTTLLVFLFLPLYSFGGFLVVPDGPMIFAWLVTLYAMSKISLNPSAIRMTDWLLVGLGCGLAVLSKLTGLLLLGSVGLWALYWRPLRGEWLRPRFWLGFLLFVVVAAPVFYWNYQNDFPTLKFQLVDRHTHGSFGWCSC